MRRALLLLGLWVVALLPVSHAEAALYWAHGSSFGKANLDGSLPFWPLPNGYFPALDVSGACGLDVDDQHLYWGDASGGAVGRATIDGTEPDQAFIHGLGAPCGVAVTATRVYWSDLETNMIGRADLDGGEVDQQFVSGLGSPCGVAVGGGHIYWGDQEPGSIGRAALDGSNVEPTLVPNAVEPWDVAVNGTHVFWANRWGTPENPGGGIGRAALDGTDANYDLVPDAYNPTGVALDARLLTPPSLPPKPSDYLRFGKLAHDKKTGTVRLIAHVPARGEFSVDSPAIGWSIDKGSPPPWVGGTFRWKLKLWPGKGRAGKRIRRQLRRKGRAPILLRVTYQQEGRLPLQASKRLAFHR